MVGVTAMKLIHSANTPNVSVVFLRVVLFATQHFPLYCLIQWTDWWDHANN